MRNSLINKGEYITNLNNKKFGFNIKILSDIEVMIYNKKTDNEYIAIVNDNNKIILYHNNKKNNKKKKFKFHKHDIKFNHWFKVFQFISTHHWYC